MRSRYSRWDGTQDPLLENPDVGEIIDDMADEILSGMDLEWVMRQFARRGISGRISGLDSLGARLRSARLRTERELNLSGPLRELRERLNEILSVERRAIEELERPDAALRSAMLDALPDAPAAVVRELMHHDFASAHAQSLFDRLMERLRKDVLDSYFTRLTGAMQAVTAHDFQRLKDMLAELNGMLAARARGDDPDFEGFMSRYRDMWPENPRDLDELLEVMARRMAAMSRLLASMTPQQRRELSELAGAVFDDLDLAFQIDQLAAALRELAPHLMWDDPVDAEGEDAMPMSAAVDAVERATEFEDLERALGDDYAGASLDDIDEERLRGALGDDAVRDLQRLKEIEKALERAGILNRNRGKLRLTARGARLIGERSLTRLLERIRREPTHRAREGQAEPTGQTRPWEFGSSDPISVQRTVFNAVARTGPGAKPRLQVSDFEVIETESRPRTATALLLDLSFSMPLRGHWVPAKRMALALHALIQGKYPDDSLYVVGFSDYARRMEAVDLATAGWEEVQGTNMEHAFILARRCLARDPRAVKQVIMVTDGEPTVHLEDGCALFTWPPTRDTIESTLRAAMRVARSGVTINVFMLERSRRLTAFMDRLARLTGGRVMSVPSQKVGTSVIGDFLTGRPGGF